MFRVWFDDGYRTAEHTKNRGARMTDDPSEKKVGTVLLCLSFVSLSVFIYHHCGIYGLSLAFGILCLFLAIAVLA